MAPFVGHLKRPTESPDAVLRAYRCAIG